LPNPFADAQAYTIGYPASTDAEKPGRMYLPVATALKAIEG
jgi:hypothetical protein